jgi:DNA-directed RNA polymerase specialized sigma subunit
MTALDHRPPATDQALWDALHRATRDQLAIERARAEDALFRHYLPLAGAVVRSRTTGGSGIDSGIDNGIDNGIDSGARGGFDRQGAEQAAEVALARAILDWNDPHAERFESFARLIINRELRAFGWRTRPRTRSAANTGPAW